MRRRISEFVLLGKFGLMRRLILIFIQMCGACLGWLAYIIKIEPARVSRININLVFPELSTQEIDKLVRRSMYEYGKLVPEMLVNWFFPSDLFSKQIRQVHGEAFFKEALEKKRGIIFVLPHLGNWEIFNYILGPHKPYALYRPIKNKFLDNVVKKSRERPGTKMVPFTVAGVRQLYRVLADGGIVKALPDQLPDGLGSVVVDFFNVPAGTGTMLPRMIQKSHPAVICCYAERLSWARGYDIHLVPALSGVYSADLAQSAAALNKSMEQIIRRCPEQYLWGYKRFKYTVDPELYSRNSPVQ